MCYDDCMIDFPIGELMYDSTCTLGLERYLHLQGMTCPHWGSGTRRRFRAQEHFPAYRSRACDGYYTLLTGTVLAKMRQRPATLVLLRGVVTGELTARLAHKLRLSCKQLHTLQRRLQTLLNATAPTEAMAGTIFEADELYQNARETKHAASQSRRPATAARP